MIMKIKFILVIEKKIVFRYYVCMMWLYYKIVENYCYVFKILKWKYWIKDGFCKDKYIFKSRFICYIF